MSTISSAIVSAHDRLSFRFFDNAAGETRVPSLLSSLAPDVTLLGSAVSGMSEPEPCSVVAYKVSITTAGSVAGLSRSTASIASK